MYQQFFGLDEPPFAITPDPRFVFLSERHRDALAHLLYGIGQGGASGFVQLTGEVGTGKTTLSRLLLEQLPAGTHVALVLNPKVNPRELLITIGEELGLDLDGRRSSIKRLVDALNEHFLDVHARGERVVVILDEAQNLSTAALEQVRLLTNLETPTQKLCQILLLGQPELREMLAQPDLRQLAQRITARFHLTPLDRHETAAYVQHRLAVAGAKRALMTPAALAALHQRAGGVPRLINLLGERALLAGYVGGRATIDARLVHRAADEVLGQHRSGRAWWPWAALAAVAALVLGAAWYWRHAEPAAAPAAAAPPAPRHASAARFDAVLHPDVPTLARAAAMLASGARSDRHPAAIAVASVAATAPPNA